MKTAYTDLYNIAHFYYNTLLCMESLGNAMKKRNYRKINKKKPQHNKKDYNHKNVSAKQKQ